MLETFSIFILSGFLAFSPIQNETILAQKTFSLTNRHSNPWVNEVFADNIVLTLHYLGNHIKDKRGINWQEIRQPFEVSFTLKPGETFAFQGDVLAEFQEKVAKTTHATFNSQQGFRGSGRLIGDGVCHLASFINWVAREAGLEVKAQVNHNFAPIPDVPKEFGTSIFYMPGNISGNAQKNLYITNNLEEEVTFNFTINQERIILTISK